MKGALYPKIFDNLFNGTVSLVNDTVKAALMTSDFSFNVGEEDWNDQHECQDEDYFGAQTLAITHAEIDVVDKTITISTSNTTIQFVAEGNITGAYIVLYIDAGADKKLMACFDLEGAKASGGEEFEVNLGAKDGFPGNLFYLTVDGMPS